MRCRSEIASSCPQHQPGRLRLTKRRRGCLLVTHLGVAVLHSKRRSCVITAAFCLPIPLCAYLSPVSLSHCTPHFSHFAFLELARTHTHQRSLVAPFFLSLPPPHPLCHDTPALCSLMITSYPRSAYILLHLSLFLALVSFRTSSHSLASPPPASPFPFSPPSTPPFLPRHLSRLTELSIHYSICYLIVCAVWFVVYLTLTLLSDVVDHSGNETTFGFSHPLLECFRSHT